MNSLYDPKYKTLLSRVHSLKVCMIGIEESLSLAAIETLTMMKRDIDPLDTNAISDIDSLIIQMNV